MNHDAYFDSSVLVAIYVTGAFSTRARAEALRAGSISFTPLHELEVRNALRALSGRRAFTEAQRHELEALIDDDLREHRLAVTPLDFPSVFRRAAKLSAAHTTRLLCRSLDILHVAAALELGATKLISADERQLGLASAIGLTAVDIRR